MLYTIPATAGTPFLLIYLIDVSRSMDEKMGTKSRLRVVAEAILRNVRLMKQRSLKGNTLIDRYRLAMLAYSDVCWDLLDGIKSIRDVPGGPLLESRDTTYTAAALERVECILNQELPKVQHCPAPLVCHITDGECNGEDPEPVADRIRQMRVPDGNVLLMNIFISNAILASSVDNSKAWPGVLDSTPLLTDYAMKLRRMSSKLPDSYRDEMRRDGYSLQPGAYMMIPGLHADLVNAGVRMCGATATR